MHIECFYDKITATFTYVIVDEKTKKSAIIDSVLDYDHFSGKVWTENADKVVKYIKDNDLTNEWILETHIHADHITASQYLKEKVGGIQAMGSGIKSVLEFWVPKFHNEKDTPMSGDQFEKLFSDGEKFNIGSLEVEVWHTPGHTPACASYLVNGALFVGDTIFAPEMGTARCDFPGGDAELLYNSIQRFFSLPDETKIYLCHDYPKEGEKPKFLTSIGEEKEKNIQINQSISKEDYIAKRRARDKELNVPKLLFPSIQANMRLGEFGEKSTNNMQYIKIPVNML